MKEIRITASMVEKEFRFLAHILKMERFNVNSVSPYLKMEVGSTGTKKYRLMIGYRDPSKEDRVFSTAEFMTLREMHYHIVGLVEGIKQGSKLQEEYLAKQITGLGITILPEDRQKSLERTIKYLSKELPF